MKKNLELLIGLLIGIAISITGTALAETLVNSEEVPYSNTDSSGTYDDVQDAIDELYKRANYLGYEYQEELLNGAYPVLGDGMIPIYLSDNGDAYYADLYTKWYSYKEKKWANAIMLTDTGKTKDYKTGDKIDEDDIRAYFVWIPRYAYKIWDLGKYEYAIEGNTLNDLNYEHSTSQASNNARIIDIVFGTKNYFDSGAGSSLSAKSLTWKDGQFTEPTGITEGNYLQHPGFTLGNEDLNGIWVGKFENSKDGSGIFVKPSETAWTNVNVDTIFKAAIDFNATLNSHMMKNTEWGAAAYLSHSAYGKGAQVNINNNSEYKTGYSAAPDTDQSSYQGTFAASDDGTKTQPWNTAVGYLASTTGNITGIYDMSGGAWEYLAAAMSNGSGDASGMKENIESYAKLGYIDLYDSSSTSTSYSKRILGDATGEMGPFYTYYSGDYKFSHNSWYADDSLFVDATGPWFGRGGHFYDGVLAGQFYFDRYTGAADGGAGSRLVLTGTSSVS